MRIFSVVFYSLFVLLGGCSTTPPGFLIREANQSLGDIRAAISQTIGEPRKTSQNQREFLSRYFSRKPDKSFDPQKSTERAYAHITVLGDRRPYNIIVAVKVERRQDGPYVEVGMDEKIAKDLALEMHAVLVKSKDGRNIIDEFRAF